MRYPRLLLLPLVIGLIALGGATAPTWATESHSQSGGGTVPAVHPDAIGSGADNVYSVDSAGLPNVPNPGQYLYVQGCSTCHGLKGEGVGDSPPLIGVGAAAADFFIRTGRMPLNQPVAQAPRKEPLYNDEQRAAIVEYVASLHDPATGPGPEIPHVDLDAGDLIAGNELYANNCAACHNSAGSGGALGRNYYAPRLDPATPIEVAEAIRIGPGAMPVFGPDTLTDEQVDSLVKYVGELKGQNGPGGNVLGRLGPVSEGFFAWIVGLGLLLALTRWIGTRV